MDSFYMSIEWWMNNEYVAYKHKKYDSAINKNVTMNLASNLIEQEKLYWVGSPRVNEISTTYSISNVDSSFEFVSVILVN